MIHPEAATTAPTSPVEEDLEAEIAQSLEQKEDMSEGVEDASASDAPPAEEHDAVLDSDNDQDNDGDSLFGGRDESMAEGVADASGESEDASGDSDGDADGAADLFDAKGEDEESDDAPLSQTTAPPAKANGLSLALPGQKTDEPAKPEEEKKPAPKTNVRQLPKPMFGSMSVPWQYDADVSRFSSDIMLTSTLSGQVLLWDRRVDSKARPGVRALPLPPNTPPWCMSACWNYAGDKIYVGRRNETVDEWDVRMLPDLQHPERGPSASPGDKAPRHMRSLRLPRGSGPVSSVVMMPNDQHIVCASFDNVRLWNTHTDPQHEVPFKIVAGHHGGTISQMLLDERAQFLLTSSGDRGWFASSTETLLMHEIMAL